MGKFPHQAVTESPTHVHALRAPLQGSANPQTPGSENKRIKSCVLLPAAGRRTQLVHLIFTEPRVCGFAQPCIAAETVRGAGKTDWLQ